MEQLHRPVKAQFFEGGPALADSRQRRDTAVLLQQVRRGAGAPSMPSTTTHIGAALAAS